MKASSLLWAFIKRIRVHPIEWGIFAVALIISLSFALYVEQEGLTRIFVDQNAHLNIARQVTDSKTPGMSQLGFWPPLLHILMAPAAMIDNLFQSGLAGAVIIAPILALGAVFLYRLSLLLYPSRALALGATGFFLLNPYLLYYAATPMTESLFLSLLMITAYSTLRWMQSDSLVHLAYAGIATALTSLARFEGFFVVGVVAMIAAVHLLTRRAGREKIEAVLVLFLFLALLGLAFVLIYGWIFAGNPLEFVDGRWSAAAQQEGYPLPTRASFSASAMYMAAASFFMLGAIPLTFSLSVILISFFIAPRRMQVQIMTLTMIFAAPLFFLFFALYKGDALIYVNILPPFTSFYNERYGLQGLGVLVFGVVASGAAILHHFSRLRVAGRSFVLPAEVVLAIGAVVVQASFFSQVVFAERFAVVRSSSERHLSLAESEAAEQLAVHYDEGIIFMTRALNHIVAIEAGIPLKKYVYEGNGPLYDQALAAPWDFARFVIMHNPESERAEWIMKNELIAARWGHSEEFANRYDLLFENEAVRLYRLRESSPTNSSPISSVQSSTL